MFNQKGQAFSVFELMIAAIVAVAILFVLLPILSGIQGGGTIDAAKNTIANGLSSVKNGGAMTTQEFTLQKDDLLTSKMFSDKGFDQHSIVFDVETPIQPNFEATIGDGYSFFKYNASTNITVVARVVCEITGDSLQQTLDGANIAYNNSPVDLCGAEGADEVYQPCCIVILKRA